MGTNTGTFIARSPKRRGAAGAGVFFSVVVKRERRRTTRPQPNALSTTRRLLSHFPIASSTTTHLKGRVAAGVGGERGLFTRFSNHHHVSVRRQPRGSFGIYAPVANRYCQQRGGSGPLWVGPTPRPPLTNLIDNLRSARNDHPMTVQPLFCDPRLRLQGNSNPPTTHRVPAYREMRSPLQGRTPIRAGRFPP